eukprot:COSAG04_NODE_695_length_11066_cov_14.905352_2_plen_53_part_00
MLCTAPLPELQADTVCGAGRVLDVLFKDVGLVGMFADFPATVSAYVNCILDQ